MIRREGTKKSKSFTPKTAKMYIYNTVFESKSLEAFEESLLESSGKTIEQNIDVIVNQINNLDTLSADALINAFTQLWDQTYPELKIEQLKEAEDSSSDSDEMVGLDEIKICFKQNAVELSAEVAIVLAQQYQSILQWLDEGKVCVRWTFLNGQQKEKVRQRLLEGMCAVFIHLMAFHTNTITGAEAIQECLSTSIIILHGSYLFGADTYLPKDMDVIIISEFCDCKSARLPKLSRLIDGDHMTIGHQCSVVDIMVGIPICCTDHMLDSYSAQNLRLEALEMLKAYLKSIPDEQDLGKQYRKLVNCALIIQYLLEKAGEKPDQALQKYIDQANNAIATRPPSVSLETNRVFYQECLNARKQL